MVRSTNSPNEFLVNEAATLEVSPNQRDHSGPTNVELEVSVPSEESFVWEHPIDVAMGQIKGRPVRERVSQLESGVVSQNQRIGATNTSTDQTSGATEPSPPAWNVIDNSRTSKCIHVINRNWGIDWYSQLRSGDLRIQDKPTYQLAHTLSRLSEHQPSVPAFLATFQGFRDFQIARSGIYNKHVTRDMKSLHDTKGQRENCVALRVLQSWLEFLQAQSLGEWLSTGTEHSGDPPERGSKRAVHTPSSTTGTKTDSSLNGSLVEILQSDIETRVDDNEQTMDANPVRMAPEQDLDMRPDGEPRTTVADPEDQADIRLGGRPHSSRGVCPSIAATERFLEIAQSERIYDTGSTRRLFMGILLRPSDRTIEQSRSEQCHVLSSNISPPARKSQPCESLSTAVATASTFLTPQSEKRFEDDSDLRLSLIGGRKSIDDCSFAPGVKPLQPCPQCGHTLIKAKDGMKDNKNLVHWKKKCQYCRTGEARPTQCSCHKCYQRSSGQEIAAVGHEATPSPTRDDSMGAQDHAPCMISSSFGKTRLAISPQVPGGATNEQSSLVTSYTVTQIC